MHIRVQLYGTHRVTHRQTHEADNPAITFVARKWTRRPLSLKSNQPVAAHDRRTLAIPPANRHSIQRRDKQRGPREATRAKLTRGCPSDLPTTHQWNINPTAKTVGIPAKRAHIPLTRLTSRADDRGWPVGSSGLTEQESHDKLTVYCVQTSQMITSLSMSAHPEP